MWTSALTVLKKASDLGDLLPYRLSEPSSRDQVMESTKDSTSEFKFFNVSYANALRDPFNLGSSGIPVGSWVKL
jgi:hypothetical protein